MFHNGSDPFPSQWREGIAAEKRVEHALDAHGVMVSRPEKNCRPHIGARHGFKDCGDLLLTGTPWIIEVKSRRQAFCNDPRKFPHLQALVDSAHAVEHWNRVCAAVIVSQSTRAMVVVPASSRPAWVRGEIVTKDGRKPAFFVQKSKLRQFRDFAFWARSCQAVKSVGH